MKLQMKIKSVFLWSMGCRKLTYYQNETPLKVVYKADERGQKPVQRFIRQDKLAESFPGYSPYNYVKNSPINYIDPNGMYPDSWQRPGETVVAYNIRMNSPELYNMMYSDGVGGSGGGAGFAYAGGHYGWVKYTQYWYSYLPENEGKKITYTFGERDYYKFEWVEGPNVAQGGGDYFPGMPPPDGRIDLSASKTPYSDVINFMKALITDESKRGLIEKYFAPGNGQVNAGYAIISYPMNVQGHRVVVNLTFDPEHELTGVISPKRMKNPYGQMEYGLIARGASLFNDGNSTVSPWLINVHYPVGAGDLYRRTYEYLIGDRETWW
jgi:RHS repeat-associated protein